VHTITGDVPEGCKPPVSSEPGGACSADGTIADAVTREVSGIVARSHPSVRLQSDGAAVDIMIKALPPEFPTAFANFRLSPNAEPGWPLLLGWRWVKRPIRREASGTADGGLLPARALAGLVLDTSHLARN
jgi:hypothetical protein